MTTHVTSVRVWLVLTVAMPLVMSLGACSSGSTGPSASSRRQSTASSSPSRSIAPSVHPDPSARRAAAAIRGLTEHLGNGGVSVAAVDTATGTSFHYGASGGMRCGSIAKLAILEVLLLRHQNSSPITAAQRALAVRMIENSDNAAADSLWQDIGEGDGLRHAEPALGLHHTTPGDGIYWGYTTTSATDYLSLLRDLVDDGPLNAYSRHLVLHLMSHVESDQRWGVGTAADRGTVFYNKNGWLSVTTDDDRWLVDSVGIVTAHGHRLLMALLTQHGAGFDQGVSLVDKLSQITAKAVR